MQHLKIHKFPFKNASYTFQPLKGFWYNKIAPEDKFTKVIIS